MKVDDLAACLYEIGPFLIVATVRLVVACSIIGINIYLYWSTFRAKGKLKSLVMDSGGRDGGVKNIHILIKKYRSIARVSLTLLLIIFVDGVLRIVRVILFIGAIYYGFTENDVYHVMFLMTTNAEYINHPVVYGLMLRGVYQVVCCKEKKNFTS